MKIVRDEDDSPHTSSTADGAPRSRSAVLYLCLFWKYVFKCVFTYVLGAYVSVMNTPALKVRGGANKCSRV